MGRKITDEELKEMVENEKGYVFHSSYTKGKGKRYMTITCPNGHTYDKRMDGWKNGERCKECQRLTQDEVRSRIEKEGYKLLSEYKSYHEKILVQCSNGREPYEVQLANFDCGKRCPYCSNNFKGENKIMDFLRNNNIEFIPQYIYEECKYIQPMPFDFYLPKYNLCIEYDGEQHFKPISFGGSYTKEELEERFKIRKLKDEIKNTYCKEHNIDLLRIPYYDINKIEEILSTKLL